tara:strand:+ start:1246 stop:1608 length:363 start_codon:yes stop_codon:yes gene_type:complete
MKSKFEEKFNVGDKITGVNWANKTMYLVIKYIGGGKFFGKDMDGAESAWPIDSDWKLYKEPVKKDLIDVKVVYKIIKESYGLSLISYLVDDEMLDNWKEHNPQTEYITKKEAIERGLKID